MNKSKECIKDFVGFCTHCQEPVYEDQDYLHCERCNEACHYECLSDKYYDEVVCKACEDKELPDLI